MKFVTISPTVEKYYEAFDPFGLLKRMQIGGLFALGITDVDEDMFDIPKGLLIYRLLEDDVIIEWLWVSSEYRNEGVGEAVIKQLIEETKVEGISHIFAYFVESANRDLLCHNVKSYFKDWGFIEETNLAGEWHAILNLILKQNWLKLLSQKYSVQPLCDMSSSEYASLVQAVGEDKSSYMYISLAENESSVDKGVSFCAYDDDKNCVGAIFWGKTFDTLCLLGFAADNEEVAKVLLAGTFLEAKEKYGTEIHIFASLYADTYEKLFEKVMPDSRCNTSVLMYEEKYFLNAEPIDLRTLDFNVAMINDMEYFTVRFSKYFKSAEEHLIKTGKINNFVNQLQGKINVETIPISKIDIDELENILLQCKADGYTGALERITSDFSVEWLDLDVSFVVKGENGINGVILIGNQDGVLVPLILHTWKDAVKLAPLALMYASASEYLNKRLGEVEVHLRLYSQAIEELYTKFFK